MLAFSMSGRQGMALTCCWCARLCRIRSRNLLHVGHALFWQLRTCASNIFLTCVQGRAHAASRDALCWTCSSRGRKSGADRV